MYGAPRPRRHVKPCLHGEVDSMSQLLSVNSPLYSLLPVPAWTTIIDDYTLPATDVPSTIGCQCFRRYSSKLLHWLWTASKALFHRSSICLELTAASLSLPIHLSQSVSSRAQDSSFQAGLSLTFPLGLLNCLNRLNWTKLNASKAHHIVQGWNCQWVGEGWPPVQTLIFEWRSALDFNPWAKFQTFRHLTPSSFRSIPTLILSK